MSTPVTEDTVLEPAVLEQTALCSKAGTRAPMAPFPARPGLEAWPATRFDAGQVAVLVASPPFRAATADQRGKLGVGVRLLLDWLTGQPGRTWQQRWQHSGAEAAGDGWRRLPMGWAAERGHGPWRQQAIVDAVPVLVSADVLRPSLGWLVGGGLARGGRLVAAVEASRDPDGVCRLRAQCADDEQVSATAEKQAVYRSALMMAAKGGVLADVTVGDIVELLDIEARVLANPPSRSALFYRLVHALGGLGPHAPATLRALRTAGQRSPEELIDRYGLSCRPVRDLLVDYLRERQPALDYTSLVALSYHLGKRFWADLEHHHPGIDSLALPREVADGWKRRLATTGRTTRDASGHAVTVTVPRINYRECLTPVRALYLDLAHWAVEEPTRWARWVAPCPVGAEEINRKKAKRQLKSRMDARTRERLPVLPVLARSVADQRRAAADLLAAARATTPGAELPATGATLVRCAVSRGEPGKVWMRDPVTGRRRDLTREEDHAFWAWAAVEVLHATGVRVEELTELSHHSLVQYRLPGTGELVPLLQIAPSKTDTERLLVVSPELADVLAAVISRVRGSSGAVPLVPSYDQRERVWAPPAPLLFQHQVGGERRAVTACAIRKLLHEALARTELTDPDGQPLHYTPHDFRRMFITDAIMNGLPPHIAQVIAGHRDINVTLGYKAVYPEEEIQAHLAFLARRRALRPSEEYRTPSDEEWQEFLGHFERRKLSVGTCARAFGTPCIHEHACVRCSMLWPDPRQAIRLLEIRDNLLARITEAEREGWHGELDGLRISLAGAEDKLSQINRRATPRQPTNLGMPGLPRFQNAIHGTG